MQTVEIVKVLRCCASIGWSGCSFCQKEELDVEEVGCRDALSLSAADRLEELLDRCARYAEEIAVLLERQRWIPVTERLPETGTPVLVNYIGNNDNKMHPDGVVVWTDTCCLWWEGSLKDCDTEVAVPITHWMPLPPAPEVE